MHLDDGGFYNMAVSVVSITHRHEQDSKSQL
jgi:hypothetical protein